MDSLSLQLTGGPQGYRVNLKNMEIFGASNFTVKNIKYVSFFMLRLIHGLLIVGIGVNLAASGVLSHRTLTAMNSLICVCLPRRPCLSSLCVRLSENNRPFEARIAIPRLTIRAKYTSSGVLLIIPASGSGDFDGVLDGVVADIKGQISTEEKAGKNFLHVDSLALELNVKKVRMHIAKVFKNNRILSKFRLGHLWMCPAI